MRGLDLGLELVWSWWSSWPLVYYLVGFFEEFVVWRGVAAGGCSGGVLSLEDRGEERRYVGHWCVDV